MAAVSERVGLNPERAWLATVVALVAALVVGSLAFPRTVYDGFVWQYFWGPVYADAHGAECAAITPSGTQLFGSTSACNAATGIVAYPGYTLVSEVGYATVLVLALVGIAFMLRRLGVERYREMFFGLFPFMIFGGALRVVEDVNDANFRATGGFAADGQWLIDYPLNTILISPLIYGTVFLVALGALLASLYLDRQDVVNYGFEYPLAALGSTTVVVTIGYLVFMANSTQYVTFHATILVVIIVGTLAVTGITWLAISSLAPQLNRGTGLMGLAVLYGQVVDGVANVVGLDWAQELGLPGDLVPKHPVNQFVVDTTQQYLPASIANVTGVAWPFLLIKVAAALFILWIFDETVMEDSPQYAVMLLLAAVAVGVGPGTRDMLRATFGV